MGLDDPSRIVFTNPVARRIHLQVKALADVFVDTPQYNGHGTATDALWAGVLGCVCVCVCARARVCVCVCVHTYIHAYINTYVYTCMHTYNGHGTATDTLWAGRCPRISYSSCVCVFGVHCWCACVSVSVRVCARACVRARV